MAIAFVQAATIKTATNVTQIQSNNLTTTSGNATLAVVSAGMNTPTAWQTTTGSDGTFANDKSIITAGGLAVCCQSTVNITGGAAHNTTTKISAVGGDMCAAYLEYSGVATSSAFDTGTTNSGTSTGPTTGSVTAANSGSLFVIAETSAGSPTITPNGGWNQRSENESGSSAQPLNVSDQITSGALNGGWTLGSSQAWCAVIAIYKPMAAAAAVAPQSLIHSQALNQSLNF